MLDSQMKAGGEAPNILSDMMSEQIGADGTVPPGAAIMPRNIQTADGTERPRNLNQSEENS